jgi:hypothetical protein
VSGEYIPRIPNVQEERPHVLVLGKNSHVLGLYRHTDQS